MTADETTTTPEVDDVDVEASDAFGDPVGDALPRRARKALVTLLTSRFVTSARHPEAWAGLLAYEGELRARLDELFLELVVDRDHEVAFKRQNGEDDVPVLLRREKPLSRDATFLLIMLRREHAYTDAADEPVTITRDQVAEFLGRFHDDDANDEVRAHRRVSAAIAAVERLGLLDAAAEDPELYVVSPAIVPVVTTTELARFERVYLAQTAVGAAESDDAADDHDGPVVDDVAAAETVGEADDDPEDAFEPEPGAADVGDVGEEDAAETVPARALDEVELDLDGIPPATEAVGHDADGDGAAERADDATDDADTSDADTSDTEERR